MADSNITLAFHLVNGSSLPRFLAATNVDTVALEGGNGLGRTLSVYSNSKIHRRPNSFESLNSSSSEYEYDWSNMEQLLQEQAKENTDKDIIKRTKLQKIPSYDKDVYEDEDEAVSVTTQHELDWFKSTGLDSVLAKVLSSDSQRSDDLELAAHLTASQTATVRRRLASLQGTLSKASSQQILEALSLSSSVSDLNIIPLGADSRTGSSELPRKVNKSAQWKDVRDVFQDRRRSSSSSESQDGDLDQSSPSNRSPHSNKSPRNPFDSPDSSVVDQKLSDIYPENFRPYADRKAYCLTRPCETISRQRTPPHRWRAPLGGQSTADVVSDDLEPGVKILKINYKSGYDTVVELDQPPRAIWPKHSPVANDNNLEGDIQLEFAYKLHPAGSPDPEWPNVIPRNPPTGVTHVDDLLWEEDVISMRQLALIELTRISDDQSLTLSKRRQKPKKKIKNSAETGVFGSSLDRLIVLDNNRRGNGMIVGSHHSVPNVPIVFQQMISYMEECGGICEEGVLRVCGETNRMRRLRAELDSYYSTPVSAPDDLSRVDETQWFRRIFQAVSVHDIASVIKQFLRDLPQPLLTNELVDAFIQVAEIPDRLTQIQTLNLLVLQLPVAERSTLKALLRFLRKVVVEEKTSKMSSANIALIMCPNLFHPKIKSCSPQPNQGFLVSNLSLSSTSSAEKQEEATKQFGIVEKLTEIARIMIEYSTFLFSVPPSFICQIRKMHLTEKAKEPKKRKDRKYIRLNPRKIRPKAAKNLPVLPEADKTDSTFFQQQFPNENAEVIRVRLARRNSNDGDNRKVSTAVQITPGLNAGDVVAKFLPNSSAASSPEMLTSLEPLNSLSTSSGISGSDKSSSSSNENLLEIEAGRSVNGSILDRHEAEPPVSLQTHYLVEQGGNIGLRRLDHHISMMAAFRANPAAIWIIKYFPNM